MRLDANAQAAIAKARWLAAFMDAVRQSSRLFMSEASLRSMALKHWSIRQGSDDPADAGRRLSGAAVRA